MRALLEAMPAHAYACAPDGVASAMAVDARGLAPPDRVFAASNLRVVLRVLCGGNEQVLGHAAGYTKGGEGGLSRCDLYVRDLMAYLEEVRGHPQPAADSPRTPPVRGHPMQRLGSRAGRALGSSACYVLSLAANRLAVRGSVGGPSPENQTLTAPIWGGHKKGFATKRVLPGTGT